MALIDPQGQRAVFKIVYCGPEQGGKTTNVKQLLRHFPQHQTGNMIQLEGDGGRTLFFDFLPIQLGRVDGLEILLHVYTTPGQIALDAARRTVLDAADGLIFVADSESQRQLENFKSMEMILDALPQGHQVPFTIQYNKRDIDFPIEIGSIQDEFRLDAPSVAAIADQGIGVVESLQACMSRLGNIL